MTTLYYSDAAVTLYHGDMRDVLPTLDEFNACITDPPYGETSLEWDRWPLGWPTLVAAHTNSMWSFGSMRMFTDQWTQFNSGGWKLAQDIVWEKHNGSGFAADRFKRVHELVVHLYHGQWSAIHHQAIRVLAHARHVDSVDPSDERVPHTGAIGPHMYRDDGKRMMRSVIKARSMHGYAIHPTEKPPAIIAPLIEYSVPLGGLVLDPFAGSGSTLLTARSLERRAIGIEASEQYCEAAAKRLSIPDLFGGAA